MPTALGLHVRVQSIPPTTMFIYIIEVISCKVNRNLCLKRAIFADLTKYIAKIALQKINFYNFLLIIFLYKKIYNFLFF
jgi:hypothetical protein